MQIEPSIYGDHHWSKQTFVNELTNEKSFYFGAFDKESQVLLAYTGFWLIVGEAHITTLAVHPDHRRKSIGERLLINTIIKARELGAEWLTLEARIKRSSKRSLFQIRFFCFRLAKRYYQDNGENALVLWTDKISEESFQNIFNARVAELGLEPVVEAALVIGVTVNDVIDTGLERDDKLGLGPSITGISSSSLIESRTPPLREFTSVVSRVVLSQRKGKPIPTKTMGEHNVVRQTVPGQVSNIFEYPGLPRQQFFRAFYQINAQVGSKQITDAS